MLQNFTQGTACAEEARAYGVMRHAVKLRDLAARVAADVVQYDRSPLIPRQLAECSPNHRAGFAAHSRGFSTLDFEPRPGNAAGTAAKLTLDGRLAGIEVNLAASGTGDIADPAAADLQLDGRLDAADARTLASFIGLDAFVNADARPARLTLLMTGAADRSSSSDSRGSTRKSTPAFQGCGNARKRLAIRCGAVSPGCSLN